MTPADLAKAAIEEAMDAGSDKDGCDDSWMEKSVSYHGLRVVRHVTTALLIYSGGQTTDVDGVRGHLKNALTRLSMIMWIITFRNATHP
jgi:hypothetical protein